MPAKQRACSTRTPGATYSVTNLTPTGTVVHYNPITKQEEEHALEWFVNCPPIEIDPSDIGISDVGIYTLPRPGDLIIYDLWDVVGGCYYEYFPEFWEEGLLKGFSRKANNAQFELLAKGSEHNFVHSRGLLDDYDVLFDNRVGVKLCPQGHKHHDENEKVDFCVSLLWEAMGPSKEFGRQFNFSAAPLPGEDWPEYIFPAAHYPKGYNPVWRFAKMMSLPITDLEVIYDPIGGAHEKAMDLIKNSKTDIPYTLMEE